MHGLHGIQDAVDGQDDHLDADASSVESSEEVLHVHFSEKM